MTAKSTFVWVLLAAALFAIIFFYQRHVQPPPSDPVRVLAGLQSSLVIRVQVSRPGQSDLRAERTNRTWRLTMPVPYPAQSPAIEGLLTALDQLTAATVITPLQLRDRPRARQEFGLNVPQAAISLEEANGSNRFLVGQLTAPGDKLYLQVLGDEAVYVVDSALAKIIPLTPNDWRNRTLLDPSGLAFDTISLTNGGISCELSLNPTNHLWRLTAPMPARADNSRVEQMLKALGDIRVSQFVPDEPKPDLEALGLQPPDLTVALAQAGASNSAGLVQFGKSPTNDAKQAYARRLGQNGIVTVPKEALAAWRISDINSLRDPRLLDSTANVGSMAVQGEDRFTLERQTNDTWRILPQNFPADAGFVNEFLSTLTNLHVQFVKGAVTAPGLADYGLAKPFRQYFLGAAQTKSAGGTNDWLAQLSFGTNREDKVFVPRTDESSVCSISPEDFRRLPVFAWQLRQRRLWQLSEEDVIGVIIHQRGKIRELRRHGENSWSLAPGTPGQINDLALESALRTLLVANASVWTAVGENNRANYGFSETGLQVSLQLKDGGQTTVEFGGAAPSGQFYAAVKLEDRLWIFEFPSALANYVLTYFSIPPDVP